MSECHSKCLEYINLVFTLTFNQGHGSLCQPRLSSEYQGFVGLWYAECKRTPFYCVLSPLKLCSRLCHFCPPDSCKQYMRTLAFSANFMQWNIHLRPSPRKVVRSTWKYHGLGTDNRRLYNWRFCNYKCGSACGQALHTL